MGDDGCTIIIRMLVPGAILTFDPIGLLQCPHCAGRFLGRHGALTCEQCGQAVPQHESIIDFVQDSVRSTLDDIDYDTFYRISEPAARSVIKHMTASAGDLWPPSLGRAIEVGAGTGGATMGISALATFEHLVVTDISYKMLRLCQRNLQAANLLRPRDMTFVTYGATQKCFRPASFDTAIGSAVLHHITDVGAFLADLADILTPAGAAFFVEPCLPFHRAVVATLADIVAGLIRGGVAYDDPGIIRMCNWMAEIRCNLLHQGDLEFLAAREDKHMFGREGIEALAHSAGFPQAVALPFGPDPSGETTLRVYLGQCDIELQMIDRVCALLPVHAPRHMAGLDPGDQAPSYLLCFSKAETSFPQLRPRNSNALAETRTAPPLPIVHCYVTLQILEVAEQTSITIDGWCFSHADLAWLVADMDGASWKFPIWLPRPDVQAAMNIDGDAPTVNVVCSGASGGIAVDRTTDAFHVDVAVMTVDGIVVPLGRAAMTRQDATVTIAR